MRETLSSHHARWLMGPYGDGRHVRMRPHPNVGRLVLKRGYVAMGAVTHTNCVVVYI